MQFGFKFLEQVLAQKNLSLTKLSDALGITPQAINGWRKSNSIPPKRASEIADYFSLGSQEIDQLLGNAPLNFSFRTKEGKDLDLSKVSARTKVRAEIIYERFYELDSESPTYNLAGLRKKISKAGNDFSAIAQAIRDEFQFPDYQPITYQTLNTILDRIKVKAFYLPFKAIGLLSTEDSEQTAVLYKKDGQYSILIDSDRTIDEGHFDKLHELIHIFLDDLGGARDDEEKLIDKICGELVYPTPYIIERFFNGDPKSKPVTDKALLQKKFLEDAREFQRIISPKGLARAMRDSGLCSAGTELFKFLSEELHSQYRAQSRTYSNFGRMNIEFSDRKQIIAFYDYIDAETTTISYPLFEKLRADLKSDKLSPSDFADTFKLALGDAMIIKALWMK